MKTKLYRLARRLLLCCSVALWGIGCAVVAYQYCALEWCGRYGGCSAPPDVAFFYAIPFAAAILLCLWLARVCGKQARRAEP